MPKLIFKRTYEDNEEAYVNYINGEYKVANSYPNERWKPVAFNDNYLISDYGRGIRLADDKIKYDRFMIYHKDTNGYLSFNIQYKRYRVHRLVAEVFCERKDGCDFVNHKDENILNNYYENLEWCTKLYNNVYSCGIKVQQYDLKTHDIIATYNTAKEAQDATDCRADAILKCCRREPKFNSVGGYGWKFPEDDIYERENKCLRKVVSIDPHIGYKETVYNSICEAAKKHNVNPSSIQKAIVKGHRCKFKYWKYAV